MKLLIGLSHWLGHTNLGIFMRDSSYAFPAIEMLHLLALAIFGGTVLLVNLRFLNLGFKTQAVPDVTRELLPFTLGGVVAMAVTGVLMYAGCPIRYLHNPAFQAKMVLFTIAFVLHFTLQIAASRSRKEMSVRMRLYRVGAVVSLLLWFAIGVCGRIIGYL